MFRRSRLALAGVALIVSFAVSAADPNKVLRTYFPAAETGFDPVRISDIYSASVAEVIFDRLLTYDYLARPAKLAPMAADLPEVSDEGRTFTFHLKKGIHFAPDPAFGGKPRELTADDFIYSFKRFFDPVYHSPYAFMLDGIAGLKELGQRAQKTGEFDYQARVPGLEAPDRYTLRIKLNDTDYNFPFKLAHGSYGAVAREVVEKYGDDVAGHPVGTGPYFLKEWTRAAKIILEANPEYRGFTWDFTPTEPAWDDALVKAMKGKKMPQIGRVEISIIEESQSIWLAFENKELDYVNLPPDFRDRALTVEGDLLPDLARQGIKLYNSVDPSITYTTFNFRDPVVGGFSKENIALRRAIVMAYDTDAEIRVLRKHLALKDEMPIPPGVVGYEPGYKAVDQYDPALANKLLDRFGYKIGPDGWRRAPDGKPLVIHIATEGTSQNRQFDELWQRSLEAVKIRVQFDVSKFGDNLKAAKACKLMMWTQGWTADIPDGDNFMQLLYGPNTGQSNNGCYESKAFDAFYDTARLLPDSPQRRRLYLEMTRQMQVDGAWRLGVSRLRSQLMRPWLQGLKKHPILNIEWPYLDIDPSAKG